MRPLLRQTSAAVDQVLQRKERRGASRGRSQVHFQSCTKETETEAAQGENKHWQLKCQLGDTTRRSTDGNYLSKLPTSIIKILLRLNLSKDNVATYLDCEAI